ncbi:MAG: response regulator [Polyangiaceae bacterium]
MKQTPPGAEDAALPSEETPAFRLQAERLEVAIESIPDPLAISDAENRLALHNTAFRRLMEETGYTPRNGTPWDEVIAKTGGLFVFETEDERRRFFEARFAARYLPDDSYVTRLTGGRTFRVTARAMPGGGRVTIARDLTDDMRRERELVTARREAEAANRAKSEFLASISHELRTPLNAVLGFAQLLLRDRREPLTERQREMVKQIYGGGDHLLRLIDDVLDLARIDAKGIAISPEPVSVDDALSEVFRTLQPAAFEAGVELLRAEVPERLPAIDADRGRFLQILMNLGSNAIKYNRRGGAVTFAASEEGPLVRVTVSDTGLGVAAEHQAQLFQPFFRAGQEAGPIEGTGIGLAISRRLAEMMGGAVGFCSASGVGSEFWVEIPAHTERASRVSQREASLDGAPVVEVPRSLVLYIEDHSPNVALMADVVSNFEGVELETATTAEAGLEIARRRKPDVIVMDINLPRMSGIEAMCLLREWEETRQIPVIALTAAASPADRERGLSAGFTRYLVKPVRIEELEAALQEALA